jgi:hypothetical protein
MYRYVNKLYVCVDFLRLSCTFLLRVRFPADTVARWSFR